MDLALGGIYYFQTYYQNLLLLAVSIAMIGWMFSLYQQLEMDPITPNPKPGYHSSKSFLQTNANTLGLIALILLFTYGKNPQKMLISIHFIDIIRLLSHFQFKICHWSMEYSWFYQYSVGIQLKHSICYDN